MEIAPVQLHPFNTRSLNLTISSINVSGKALVFNVTMNDNYEKLWFRTRDTLVQQQQPTTKYHLNTM